MYQSLTPPPSRRVCVLCVCSVHVVQSILSAVCRTLGAFSPVRGPLRGGGGGNVILCFRHCTVHCVQCVAPARPLSVARSLWATKLAELHSYTHKIDRCAKTYSVGGWSSFFLEGKSRASATSSPSIAPPASSGEKSLTAHHLKDVCFAPSAALRSWTTLCFRALRSS